MGLAGRQTEAFRDGLKAAIPSETDLKEILDFRLEQDYNKVTQGETIYEHAVSNLIQWADSQGKLLALAREVAVKNPGNPEFQTFLDTHWLTLLKLEAKLLSEELLLALAEQLKKVHDFGEIAACCRRSWPQIDSHRPEILKHLRNPDLCSTAKWLMVMELWLKQVLYKPDGTAYILEFVERLEQRHQELTTWLDQARAELGVTETAAVTSLTPEQQALLQKIRGYCVIDVDILTTKDQLRYRCQLHIQVGSNNKFKEDQMLPIMNLPPEELAADSGEALQEQTPEAVVFSNPKFIPIRQQIPHWLTQVTQRLADKCTDLKQRYDLPDRPQYDLLLEFCLPWEHLVEKVDAWAFTTQVRRRSRRVCLGRNYKVVVRSRDRIHDPDGTLINQLNKVWHQAEPLRSGSPTVDDWRQVTPLLDSFDQIELTDEDSLVRTFEGYVGLGVSCPLCSPEHDMAREKLLNVALEAGVPVVVWSRDHEIEDLDAQLRQLLAPECFRDLTVLVDRVHAQRAQAPEEQPLGQCLAVWCDEPRRIEALNELFSRGRLGYDTEA